MTSFDEYKQMIKAHTGYIAELKKTVQDIILRKQLISVMNDAKWLELQRAVEKLPFPPPFILRCITDSDDEPEPVFNGEAQPYYGDWNPYYRERLPVLFNIEWIKVQPRYRQSRGKLQNDLIIDETEEFRAALQKCFIAYEEDNGLFTIYGYKKSL